MSLSVGSSNVECSYWLELRPVLKSALTMALSAAFESLTMHTLLIRLPGEEGKSTLTCKALECLA